MTIVIGIIGGSGLYDIEGLESIKEWRRVETRPGASRRTSCCSARSEGVALRVPAAARPRPPPQPTHLNYRANIDALKRAGCTERALAVRRGQPARRTCRPAVRHRRPVHRPQLRPREKLLRRRLRRPRPPSPTRSAPGSATRSRRAPARSASPVTRRGGTYLVMEGPQFSTRAESNLYRQLGLQRDRHDQHARSQARPRSGALLRHRRHGHRLRLLVREGHEDVTVEAVVQVLP